MLTCWYISAVEKYDLVGRLLKPGDEPTDYTDTEEEHGASDSLKEDWLIKAVGTAALISMMRYVSANNRLHACAYMWCMHFSIVWDLMILIDWSDAITLISPFICQYCFKAAAFVLNCTENFENVTYCCSALHNTHVVNILRTVASRKQGSFKCHYWYTILACHAAVRKVIKIDTLKILKKNVIHYSFSVHRNIHPL